MEHLKQHVVFKDPLYGYIHVDSPIIMALIDTPVFQRLRRIRQLSGVQTVFHGAEHSRFSHSLGTYEIARRFLSVPDLKDHLDERKQLLFLVSALLHDIGHGAYSHAFEDVFGSDHERIGALIITRHQAITEILETIDHAFADDVASILRKTHRFPLVEQLISSQLDVDRLDYLERDAYFTGAAYGHIDLDRLVRVMRVKDGDVVFKVSGIHAIENYLISRYHMYWQVYYHPVARAFEANLEMIYARVKYLLAKGVEFTKGDLEPLKRIIEHPEDLEAYLDVDDYVMNGLILSFKSSSDQILRTLSEDMINRRVWKHVPDIPENQGLIDDILEAMTEEERTYYSSRRSVENSTYSDDETTFGDEIRILLENQTVSSLISQSPIIESLMKSGVKKDPRFFYRKP